MRRISFEEIFGCLEKPCDTLVLFHRAPDADAVGSAYAMKKLLEAMGSRAFCVCADELPVRLSFLMFGEQESVLPERIPSDLSPERIVSVDTASPSQLDLTYGNSNCRRCAQSSYLYLIPSLGFDDEGYQARVYVSRCRA